MSSSHKSFSEDELKAKLKDYQMRILNCEQEKKPRDKLAVMEAFRAELNQLSGENLYTLTQIARTLPYKTDDNIGKEKKAFDILRSIILKKTENYRHTTFATPTGVHQVYGDPSKEFFEEQAPTSNKPKSPGKS
jgi:hypothetical protein